MEKSILSLPHMEVTLFAGNHPQALLIQPTDHHEAATMDEELALIATATTKPFAMASFAVNDWAKELMPWADRTVSRDAEVGLHATDTLSHITGELLPALRGRFGSLPVIIGGYSLGALFSLWAASEVEGFFGVAAASPSVWIKDWPEYAQSHPIRARQVYLSLGDREAHSKNKAIAQVGVRIRQQYEWMAEQLGAARTTLEWNSGSHFQDEARRVARAFAWNLMQDQL